MSVHALRQMHHLLNNKAEVNQRDEKGMTPLHRAAFLAQYDGYLELYEYLLVTSGFTFALVLKRPDKIVRYLIRMHATLI